LTDCLLASQEGFIVGWLLLEIFIELNRMKVE